MEVTSVTVLAADEEPADNLDGVPGEPDIDQNTVADWLPGIRDEHEDEAGWQARWLDRPTWDRTVTPNIRKRTGQRPGRRGDRVGAGLPRQTIVPSRRRCSARQGSVAARRFATCRRWRAVLDSPRIGVGATAAGLDSAVGRLARCRRPADRAPRSVTSTSRGRLGRDPGSQALQQTRTTSYGLARRAQRHILVHGASEQLEDFAPGSSAELDVPDLRAMDAAGRHRPGGSIAGRRDEPTARRSAKSTVDSAASVLTA